MRKAMSTAADGLAVSRPSGLVCRTMAPLLDGIYTIEDNFVLSSNFTLLMRCYG